MLQKEYWRAQLSSSDQKIYDLIRAGLASHRERTAIPNFLGNPNGIAKIYEAIWADHPEIYWQTYAPSIAQSSSSFGGGLFGSGGGGPRIEMVHPSLYQAKEAMPINAAIRNALAELDRMKGQGALELIIGALLYLAKHVTYEIDNERNQNAASALYYGRAQCTGYAKAFKLMMDHVGVPCIMISGTAQAREGDPSSEGPHAWNLVELDGACYQVDTTAVAGGAQDRDDVLASLLFLGSDEDFARGHAWDRRAVPPCPKHSPHRKAKMPVGAGIPQGMGAMPSGDAVKISSLYELRMLLNQEFASNKSGTVAFRMNVNMPPEKLYPHVQSCIQAAMNQSKVSSNVQILRQGDLYQLTRTVSP